MKTILVELDPQIGDGRLDCAADLARTFGSHIVGLQVTPAGAYVSFDPFGGIHALPAVIDALADREQETRSRFEAEMAREGLNWDYRHSAGTPSEIIGDHSRVADLLLMAKPGGGEGQKERIGHVGDVVLASSAPVLALPPETRSFDPGGKMAIAWNGSPEASRAVRSALPLLTMASEVILLGADEDDDSRDLPSTALAEYLSRHGIHPVIEPVEVRDGDVPGSLLAAVTEHSPSCLVMGAYGRSRARQWLLGGVTRRMIMDLPLPLLLAH